MNILFLRGFNNYFNRVIKKYSTLADYQSHSTAYVNFESINFNPNDGVATELVLGNESQKENNLPLDWENIGTPDYCVCYETVGSNTVIRFRWYVLESERLRSGQYRLALKRDLIADHYSEVMNAPCFVEKGCITDINNPLLYNNENMTYNQIKKQEFFLKDSTGTAWIVGYLAKNRANTPVNVSTTIAMTDGVPADYYDEEDLPFSVDPSSATNIFAYIPNSASLVLPVSFLKNGGWSRCDINQGFKTINAAGDMSANIPSVYKESETGVSYSNIGSVNPQDAYNERGCDKFTSNITIPISSSNPIAKNEYLFDNEFKLTVILDSTNVNVFGNKFFYTTDPYSSYPEKQAAFSSFEAAVPSTSSYNAVKTLVNGYMQNIEGIMYGDILSYNNKYVKVGDDYYRMAISAENTVDKYDIFVPTASNSAYPTVTALGNNEATRHIKSDLASAMSTVLSSLQSNNSSKLYTSSSLMPACCAVAKSAKYNIILSKITTEELNITLQTGKRITYDCPANIFAIPYGNIKFKTNSESDTYLTQKEEGIALARAIAQALGDSVCYDLQLVPYVPSQVIRDLMQNSDTLTLTDLESVNYDIATRTSLGTTSTATFVLYPSSCKGTFDITSFYPSEFNTENNINIYHNDLYSNAINYKISNEVQLCRLVSPNFNGIFEFSLAKNDGVTKFNVDYTYKPIMPYIHINPDFKFIYGRDWDDTRGLILGGDFSLTFINSAWVNYENNNKNYQAIFNRQIENIDVNNQIAKEQLEWQTIAGYFGGGITGAVGGAIAGAKVGGGYGAIGGAIGGAYMGTVGSIIGGEMDKEWLARQQTEAKDYTIDMYGYQLGNIKAIPYSLSRSESLTNNNKIWPILELYEPTDMEIENLINKIKYNGMTIMAIGKLSDYSHSEDFNLVYTKGQLIRLDSIDDDFHIADAIYQEVLKGFYIPSGGL